MIEAQTGIVEQTQGMYGAMQKALGEAGVPETQ